MQVRRQPDATEKLTRMGDVTLFEPAGDTPHSEKRVPYQARSLADCISHVQTPKGTKAVMKTMVTTACEKNCFYCPFRAGARANAPRDLQAGRTGESIRPDAASQAGGWHLPVVRHH